MLQAQIDKYINELIGMAHVLMVRKPLYCYNYTSLYPVDGERLVAPPCPDGYKDNTIKFVSIYGKRNFKDSSMSYAEFTSTLVPLAVVDYVFKSINYTGSKDVDFVRLLANPCSANASKILSDLSKRAFALQFPNEDMAIRSRRKNKEVA